MDDPNRSEPKTHERKDAHLALAASDLALAGIDASGLIIAHFPNATLPP